MADAANPSNDSDGSPFRAVPAEEVPPGPAFPRKMLIATGCFLLPAILAFVFISHVEDLMGVGLDMVMLMTLFGGAVMVLSWIVWFLLLSRWRWPIRIACCAVLLTLPVGFFKIFRPVNGGDATFVRFEPIWETRTEVTVDDAPTSPSIVDLKTETPDDFARFLGPNNNGIVTTGIRIDAEKFSESKQLWKQPIGKGWSAFAARNGFAVTMEQREDKECVTCYDIETGELKWIYHNPGRHQDRLNMGRTGPRATPTIHDGYVYAVGAIGNLVCLNGTDGEIVWQHNLNHLLNVEITTAQDADGRDVHFELNSTLAWGRSGSALIVDDLVVIPGGGPTSGDKTTLLAFDRVSGEPAWRGGNEMIGYGSPVLAHVAGRNQILLTTESKVMSFNPSDGKVIWKMDRPGNSGGEANTSQVTVISENEVLTSKGYNDGGGELIRLESDGDNITATSAWKNPRALKTKLTSPVILDGHAYSFSNGFLECARMSDGERIWKRRGRFGHGQLLLIDDLLIVHSEYGVAYLTHASPEQHEELGSFKTIDGVCWNTLCLYGNKLLVRSELEAACFEIPTID